MRQYINEIQRIVADVYKRDYRQTINPTEIRPHTFSSLLIMNISDEDQYQLIWCMSQLVGIENLILVDKKNMTGPAYLTKRGYRDDVLRWSVEAVSCYT